MTDEEKRLLSLVQVDDMLHLAKELIKVPSPTGEESTVARYVADYMEKGGLEVELQEVEPGRFQAIGRIRGEGGGPSLMLNGHLDEDPLTLGWKRDPRSPSLEGDRLYGAGIFNMKSGVTAMLTAAQAIKKSGIVLAGDLVIACVVGELQGGVGTVHLLKKGLRPDMAIIPEPMGVKNITTVHAGVLEFAINILGVSQHISRMEESVDAIGKTFRAIEALKKLEFRYRPRADLPGIPRLIVGTIIGGRGREHLLRGSYNVCDFCTIIVDVRFNDSQSVDSVREDIEGALNRLAAQDPEFKYEIQIPPDPKFRAMMIPMPPLDVPTDSYIVQAVRSNYLKVTGEEPRVGANGNLSYAGNDTGHLWQAGTPCCLFGPGGGYVEERDRYTLVSEMVTCARVLALTAMEVCSRKRATGS